MGPKSIRKQRNKSTEDEYARQHIEILSDKLQEMKEKFTELVEKVMGDEANTIVKRKQRRRDNR